jgi:hypothetical protein
VVRQHEADAIRQPLGDLDVLVAIASRSGEDAEATTQPSPVHRHP